MRVISMVLMLWFFDLFSSFSYFFCVSMPRKVPWNFELLMRVIHLFVVVVVVAPAFFETRTLRYASTLKRTRSFRFGWLRKVIKNACRVLHAKMEGSEETRCIWIGNKCRELHFAVSSRVQDLFEGFSASNMWASFFFILAFYLCQMLFHLQPSEFMGTFLLIQVLCAFPFFCFYKMVVSFKMLWE